MTRSARTILLLAGVFGLLAVVAGTFGAHGLEGRATAREIAIFETGQRYHMYHALAMLGCAWLATVGSPRLIGAAVGCFVGGIVIFSGALYTLALVGPDWLGMIAPIGGMLLIVGWALLIVAALVRSRARDGSE